MICYPSISVLAQPHSLSPSTPILTQVTPPAPALGGLFCGGSASAGPGTAGAAAAAAATNLNALASQHRLMELSRFGLRGYDLAQHMLSQQGAVSKLLGKFLGYYKVEELRFGGRRKSRPP